MGSKRKYDKYKKLREKRRKEIRDEMSELRRSIPYTPEAATRVQTLRIANAYIKHIENTLSGIRSIYYFKGCRMGCVKCPTWLRRT